MLGFFKNQSNKKLLCDVKLLKVISYMYVCVCVNARVYVWDLDINCKLKFQMPLEFQMPQAQQLLFFFDNEGRKIVHKSVKDLIALSLSDLRSLRKQNLNFFVRYLKTKQWTQYDLINYFVIITTYRPVFQFHCSFLISPQMI